MTPQPGDRLAGGEEGEGKKDPLPGMDESGDMVQVTNIAPNASLDQMKTMFSFIGDIEEIVLYPDE